MITLTILAACVAAIGLMILFFGAGFLIVFGDLIFAVLIIMGVIKLIGAIRRRIKEGKEET